MTQKQLEVCSVCGVKIVEGDQVLFSHGDPASRARLYARVCQYVQKPACINQNSEVIGVVSSRDHYHPI